ncbi:mRNA-capping enzyme subunit beta [Cadophora gregata]|uniref:mRNA-capping enzyme subunit beta n=1 Tax=Cadophora gregata TaxID=51156 RepID=UPI0026DAAF1B|nr:mRNA-capping enzyme subunit beta [Cadophora gregata]KAK0102678.1 mRNA-capping enzyme subunit beta [Cadophora gregata]KAK0104334.1 mRNA-capping enzyme subunit beta [Cadophora gregata f. sp. sojae]
MDLRSIINTDGGDSSKQAAPTPVTPVQAHPQQSFRDYSHPPQASPGKHPSQDYGAHPSGSVSYASPTQYQQSYQGRPPQPPPIQAPPHNDLRSPARSFSVQSPYQHTPSSSSSQYPFPQSHQTPQSPAQHHPYPPHLQQRDSYSQPNQSPQIHHQTLFTQPSPTPQTPPVGLPGAPHPYLQQHHQQQQQPPSNQHQRSVSSHSSTPTSANSQHQQQFGQYQQDSPVSANQYPSSQIPQHHRQPSQQSQPGTPLGPPLIQRQSSGAFAQPSSPYSQRSIPPNPFPQYPQTSPKPPAPPSLQRQPSTPSGYDSQRTSISEQQQQQRGSQSERERSVSVSPKTRLPSQPRGETTTPKSEMDYNQGKRKMDDREVSVEEPRRINSTDNRSQVNGNHHVSAASPQQPAKKRIRYTEPPIWAQSIRNKAIVNRGPAKVNGKQPLAVQPVHSSPAQPETNGNQAVTRPVMDGKVHPSVLLGKWEESITGIKPAQGMTKEVADFLFLNVVSRSDLGELASRGVEIEIEAKLGHIVDKETNERYRIPVKSECVLMENSRVGFQSSMTESQHRHLNDFLNAQVRQAHPNNQDAIAKNRVEIKYKHSREADSFYTLPPSMHGMIPPALREKMNPRHGIKVRITHDQKTGEPLAKIIKARIIDLDIYSPMTPLDCRISINFEMRFDGDVQDLGEKTSSDRNKDRLSYTQSMYQIDLTQVTQLSVGNGVNQTSKEHELEIELLTAAVRDQGQKAAAGEPNEYIALVEGFLDNMRILSRATPAV